MVDSAWAGPCLTHPPELELEAELPVPDSVPTPVRPGAREVALVTTRGASLPSDVSTPPLLAASADSKLLYRSTDRGRVAVVTVPVTVVEGELVTPPRSPA